MISVVRSRNFATVVLVLVALLALHWTTFASLVHGWLSSTTYNHGFVIPLIVVFVAWHCRGDSSRAQTTIWWPGLFVVLVLSALWTVATLVHVQVVAQLASVGLVSAVVLTLAGPGQAAVFAFPLGYLFFTVPFGQGMVPALMEWTADFTVGALKLFGIPVLRDGLYFSTSNGNFEIAKACSGVRYLLASAAAGTAFAFFAFRSAKKRAIFIAVSLVVPLVANGIRAVGIVLIAHYSEMRLAMGLDHFIYGWVFFGFVIFLLFLVGGRFADRESTEDKSLEASPTRQLDFRAWRSGHVVALAIAVISLIAAGPLSVNLRQAMDGQSSVMLPISATGETGWSGPGESRNPWVLGYRGADVNVAATYVHESTDIEVRIGLYRQQSQGRELVNSQNRIADDTWNIRRFSRIKLPFSAVSHVRSSRITGAGGVYTIWHWYQLGSDVTVSDYRVKWLEMIGMFKATPAMIVAIGARGGAEEAESSLKRFLASNGAALIECLSTEARHISCSDSQSRQTE